VAVLAGTFSLRQRDASENIATLTPNVKLSSVSAIPAAYVETALQTRQLTITNALESNACQTQNAKPQITRCIATKDTARDSHRALLRSQQPQIAAMEYPAANIQTACQASVKTGNAQLKEVITSQIRVAPPLMEGQSQL